MSVMSKNNRNSTGEEAELSLEITLKSRLIDKKLSAWPDKTGDKM